MMDSSKHIYGLLGYPLGHSFSKRFFTEMFEREYINAEYRNFEIPKISQFEEILGIKPSGLNVTIPYKQAVMPYLDAVDDVARKVCAVNVVKTISEHGCIKTTGYNSDVVGFKNSIVPLLKSYHNKALILGTGGASKAVAYTFGELGVEYKFVSRTPECGELAYRDLTKDRMDDYTVIVNTTPLGMFPHIGGFPSIPYDLISERHLCYDLVYNPEMTKFLELSKARGATVKNGYEMLVLQALESWRIWNA